MMEVVRLTRRELLRWGLSGLSGLVVATYVPRSLLPAMAPEEKDDFMPSVFVALHPDGFASIVVPKSEMGQGIRTGLPMILAEELDMDWSRVRVVQADAAADNRYGRQATGGSTSTRFLWEPLRKAGSTARMLLISAAAAEWGVSPDTCKTDKGTVIHSPTGRRLAYEKLIDKARTMPIPKNIPLKNPSSFHLLGTSPPRIDEPDIVTGKARYGMDIRLPDMVFAAVVQCPFFDGDVETMDVTTARNNQGVIDVLSIPAMREPEWVNASVAVIARDTWTAIRTARSLNIKWKKGPLADMDVQNLESAFQSARSSLTTVHEDGNVDEALTRAAKVVEADYSLPFLSHSPMEPMNATARFHEGRCEIWVPSQDPQRAQRAIAQVLGLKPEQVVVHVTLLGGGFGRRHQPDYAVQAALIARKVGRPVQLVWTREEDMTHDFYRPASHHHMRAGIDESGNLIAWEQTILNTREREYPRNFFPVGAIPNLRIRYGHVRTPVPWGWWRAVIYTSQTFVVQSFLDEIAVALGRDPLDFRREWMAGSSKHYPYDAKRMRRVMEHVAQMAGWGKPLPKGHGRGLAAEYCFGSYIAQVAEVSPEGEDGIRIHRVYCAIDCGQVVHPDFVRAQVEGGIVFGLSAALYQQLTLENGGFRENNFDTYPLLRMQAMPVVEVDIIQSRENPGGVGETPVPCIAPAVANAWFNATGQRIRRLPIVPEIG